MKDKRSRHKASVTRSTAGKHRTPRTDTAASIHAKKRYGQNFLIDDAIIDGIIEASGVGADDAVLEIGPGTGNLTERLCEAADEVLAIEIDPDMREVLRARLGDRRNLRILDGDILETDPAVIRDFAGDRRLLVIANLPYYITTPIIMYLLESSLAKRLSRITVMVQREVADRLTAEPGSRDYGAITVAVKYRCEAETALYVPHSAFIPEPEVESAVVTLDVRSEPPVALASCNEADFFAVVRAAFAQRRKTLVNALASAGYAGGDKMAIAQILQDNGFDARIRGEALDIGQFAAIAERLAKR